MGHQCDEGYCGKGARKGSNSICPLSYLHVWLCPLDLSSFTEASVADRFCYSETNRRTATIGQTPSVPSVENGPKDGSEPSF